VLFYLPAVASVVLFMLCWRAGLIARPGMVGGWCVSGIALQLVGDAFSPAWAAGLVISVGVAIYLSVQLKIR
jgi:hypothetical protein